MTQCNSLNTVSTQHKVNKSTTLKFFFLTYFLIWNIFSNVNIPEQSSLCHGPTLPSIAKLLFSPMEPVFTPSKLMKWFINSSLWSVTCVYLETCVPSAQWWYKPRYMILLFLCYTHATHATYALIVVVVKLLFKTYKRGKNSFLLIFSRSAVKIIEIFRTSCSFFKIAHWGRGRRSWPNCHGRTLSYYTHNDNSHRMEVI